MTTTEKILSVFLLILLVITIVLGYQKYNLDLEIGVNEYRLNELHEAQIELYDNHIVGLTEKISTLQNERIKIDEQEEKLPSITIRENDSIARLPYDEQNIYIANGLSLLDSIERRHFSGL